MRSIVRFRTPSGEFAVPVEQVTEVRLADGMRPLPSPRADVAGVLADRDGALTVLSVLGSQGQHVIIVDDGSLTFGLLVDEVLGVQHVDEDAIDPPPAGQDQAVVAGVVAGDGNLVLLLDLAVLRGRLGE
jgi:chemotaxis signal transduction protein